MAPNYLALSVPCNLSSQSACLTLLGNLVLPLKSFATAGHSVCPAGVQGGRLDPLRQVKSREREDWEWFAFAALLSVFLPCLKSGCGPVWRTPGNTWMFILSHLPSWTPHRLTSSCFGVYSTVFHPTPPSCALLPLVCGLCNCFIFPLWGAPWAEGGWDFLCFGSPYAESAQAFLSRRNSFQSVHSAPILLIWLSES